MPAAGTIASGGFLLSERALTRVSFRGGRRPWVSAGEEENPADIPEQKSLYFINHDALRLNSSGINNLINSTALSLCAMQAEHSNISQYRTSLITAWKDVSAL